MSKWQPIATAPLDGRYVLIAWADKPKWEPAVVSKSPRGLWTDIEGSVYRIPSHWMPLPAPPAVTGDVCANPKQETP
jgi:hypothetical protein